MNFLCVQPFESYHYIRNIFAYDAEKNLIFIYENIRKEKAIFASCLSLIWISKRRTHIPFSHFDVLQSLRGRSLPDFHEYFNMEIRFDDVSGYYIVCMLSRMCGVSSFYMTTVVFSSRPLNFRSVFSTRPRNSICTENVGIRSDYVRFAGHDSNSKNSLETVEKYTAEIVLGLNVPLWWFSNSANSYSLLIFYLFLKKM